MAEGDAGESHPHLRLEREDPVTERRPGRGFRAAREPDDPRGHAARLGTSLRAMREAAAEDISGFDDRRLVKIRLVEKVSPEDVARAAAGVEVVSQEDDTLVLAFASDDQLDEFQGKLTNLADGGQVSYTNVLYALQELDRWGPADRTGWALGRDGFPQDEPFVLDIELWPLARASIPAREAFEAWLIDRGGAILDAVRKPYLTLYRISCSRSLGEETLLYRDVRTVDLPPRAQLEPALVHMDIQRFGNVPSPPDSAPAIGVLDTGVVSGHPLLASAVGDAQSFLSGAQPADDHGHGTFVAAIALYDDVADCIRSRSFVPLLRVLSGRVLDQNNQADPRLIENQVDRAVRYFVSEYQCRVFNLSYGDLNKPYRGRHVSGLAVTLDALSRELNVLFTIPTGNYGGDEDQPPDWLTAYPVLLTGPNSVLIDPAPALNALTVGSLARYDRDRRWPDDLAYRPVARAGQPSPFTRHGPSVARAIKPDLVDYGGNIIVNTLAGRTMVGQQGVGELSFSRQFAVGQPFSEDSGTSFAAPRVAHCAARILGEMPNAGVDLCRALLVVHAKTPPQCADLFSNEDDLRAVTGYGIVDRFGLYRSFEDCVTLWAEELIENRRHHFFEVPVPDEFWWGGKRRRQIRISLAYRPAVRTTRIDYRAAKISFKLVQADSLDGLARRFNAAVDLDETDGVTERSTARTISETLRSKGTVQASAWSFTRPSLEAARKPWFVVVTRNDPPWGEPLSSEREPYALALVLDDRAALQPQLYTRIEARLRARIRAQVSR